MPTSGSFLLNGMPLNSKIEFVAFSLLIVGASGFALGRYLNLFRVEPSERSSVPTAMDLVAGVLVIFLLVCKFLYPPAMKLHSCIQMPGVGSGSCLWFPEQVLSKTPNGSSRLEDVVIFNEHNVWNLPSYNDHRIFNNFDPKPGSKEYQIDHLRKKQSYPFSASFVLSAEIKDILREKFQQEGQSRFRVRYRGYLEQGSQEFSNEERISEFFVQGNKLDLFQLNYRNYDCSRPGDDLKQCAEQLAVNSIPIRNAKLEVTVIDPADEHEVPLGYASLGERWQFHALEWLAGLFLFVACILRVVPALKPFTVSIRTRKQLLGASFVGLAGYGLVSHFYSSIFAQQRLHNGSKLSLLFPMGALLLGGCLTYSFQKKNKKLDNLPVPGLLLPLVLYIFFKLIWVMPATNEVLLMGPGDDHLTYASEAMGILETGTLRDPRHAPFHFASKPLFLHLRALYFAIFGGGEIYYAGLLTTAMVCVWLLFLYFLLSLILSSSPNLFLLIGSAVAFASFSRMYIDYGAVFGGMAYSEGPAWLFGGVACMALLSLPTSRHPNATLWTIGSFFALSISMRSQYVMLLPLLTAATVFVRADIKVLKLLLRLWVPSLVIICIVLANYLRYLPTKEQATFYAGVATPLANRFSWEIIIRQAKLLFPSVWEFLSVVVVSALLWAMPRNKEKWGLLAIYWITVIILNGAVVGNSGYHPRHIVLSFTISACLIVLLLGQKHASLPNWRLLNQRPKLTLFLF